MKKIVGDSNTVLILEGDEPKRICRLGQGAECCPYLVGGGDHGLMCFRMNYPDNASIMHRIDQGEMNAKGKPCDWDETVKQATPFQPYVLCVSEKDPHSESAILVQCCKCPRKVWVSLHNMDKRCICIHCVNDAIEKGTEDFELGIALPDIIESFNYLLKTGQINLEEDDMGKKITIYTIPTCPFCNRAKAYLKEKGKPFEDIDVHEHDDKAQEMIKKSGQMGVPVLDIGGTIVVGFDKEAIDKALA